MKELFERTPFKGPLKPLPGDENDHLFTLVGNDDYIIRRTFLYNP